MSKSHINPPCLLMALILLELIMHWSLDGKIMIDPPFSYGGGTLVLAGSLIAIWADFLFRKSGTAIEPYRKPCFLHTAGPFRVSRNPIYLGFTIILLGEAMLLGNILLLIFPWLFVAICQVSFIPAEEKTLREVFGSEYIDYTRRVRRWL